MSYGEAELPPSAEVVVVGAGIIGVSVAYYLARSGRQVCVLERNQVGSGASGANAGLIGVVNKAPGTRVRLIWESLQLYKDLPAELEYDFELQQPGGVYLFLTEEEKAKALKLLEGHQAMSLPTRLLSGEELHQMEPGLRRDVLGALYSPVDSYLNPMLLTVGFTRATKRLGATVMNRCEVEGIEVGGGRIQAVRTSRGRIATRIVINAAGAWSPAVGQMVGLEVPVQPSRGQMIITERSRRRVVQHLMYGLATGTRHVLNGGLIIGSTHELVGYDLSLEFKTLTAFAHEITRSFPELANLEAVRFWSGLRPATADDLPILGPAGPEGFFLATGHFKTGVATAPITGKLVAEMVNGHPPSVPIDECSFSRFSAPHVA